MGWPSPARSGPPSPNTGRGLGLIGFVLIPLCLGRAITWRSRRLPEVAWLLDFRLETLGNQGNVSIEAALVSVPQPSPSIGRGRPEGRARATRPPHTINSPIFAGTSPAVISDSPTRMACTPSARSD